MSPAAPDPTVVTVVVPLLDEWSALAARLEEIAPDGRVVEVCAAAATPAPAGWSAARPGVEIRRAGPGRGVQLNAGAAGARGRWLLFLHVDTRLPDGWLEEVARADRLASCVGGSFRFGLDSRAWQARWLERAVALRVAILDLPYGDQALFARRDVFEALGGFAPVPLMEDVEFVRRLRRAGRLYHSTRAVRTSARRWEREGWLRRSARNVSLLVRYTLGASPVTLVRAYERRTVPHD